MNTADLVVVTMLLFGGLFGFMRGFIRQLVGGIAWAASLIVPYFLAAPFGHFLSDRLDAPYAIAYIAGCVVLAIVSHFLVRLISALVGRLLRKVYDKVTTVGETEEQKAKEAARPVRGSLPDRMLGGILGAGKWGVALWALLSGFALIAKPLRDQGVHLSAEDSESYRLADEHNAFRVMWAKDIAQLNEAVHRLSTRPKAGSGPAQKSYEQLAQDDRIKKVMADEPLKRALAAGDFKTIVSSPHVLSLLTDPEAMERVIALARDQESAVGTTSR